MASLPFVDADVTEANPSRFNVSSCARVSVALNLHVDLSGALRVFFCFNDSFFVGASTRGPANRAATPGRREAGAPKERFARLWGPFPTSPFPPWTVPRGAVALHPALALLANPRPPPPSAVWP